jgi:Holliday junction resolvasome RuvABC ATP-dependent DNA helicase subunit
LLAIQISKRIELSSLATLGGYLLSFLIPENIAGVTGAPIGLDSPANSYGISTQTIADMMRPLIISDIGQGSVARNNPTRPETTAHQAISPTTQQITTEFVQVSITWHFL